MKEMEQKVKPIRQQRNPFPKAKFTYIERKERSLRDKRKNNNKSWSIHSVS